jgi:hypothetical protein
MRTKASHFRRISRKEPMLAVGEPVDIGNRSRRLSKRLNLTLPRKHLEFVCGGLAHCAHTPRAESYIHLVVWRGTPSGDLARTLRTSNEPVSHPDLQRST